MKISVEIVRSLCQAAGVFEYIRDVELARWTQKPVEAIPEKYTEFYSVLSMMSLAEAEQVMIKKSFLASMSCKDRKSTRLNSSHRNTSRMPSSA